MDLDQKHNRAIKLLQEKGHRVGESRDGNVITVDGREYKVLELAGLAERSYPDEWRKIQRVFEQKVRRKT